MEFAKETDIKKFVYASSSSVYGINPNVPWKETDFVLDPISPYASSKISGELLGHVYSHIHKIRFIGLRLFTVYGPRQRPDLAIHKFTKLIREGKPIPVYGDGTTRRDYTFVTDVVEGLIACVIRNWMLVDDADHHLSPDGVFQLNESGPGAGIPLHNLAFFLRVAESFLEKSSHQSQVGGASLRFF